MFNSRRNSEFKFWKLNLGLIIWGSNVKWFFWSSSKEDEREEMLK